MIDFDALVLTPCEDIFALRCTFTLAATKPEAPLVTARGVYSSGPIDVALQDDAIFSDQQTSLGIRLRDFEVVPDRGDLVEIAEPTHPAFGMKYWIGDVDLDGQGGAMLMLRTQEPPTTATKPSIPATSEAQLDFTKPASTQYLPGL